MPDSLGARIREARISRQLSLRSVAQSLGVSASLLSQIEIGKTQPSVSTLYALATHLGASLDDLMGLPTASRAPNAAAPSAAADPWPAVQHAADNPVIEMENGVRWERLAVGPGGRTEALLVTYEPGAASSVDGRLMRHAGEEYAYVIRGQVTLHLEFETHVLERGDSLHFDSARPHLYVNDGTKPATGVWFVTGRRDGDAVRRDSVGPRVAPASRRPGSAVDVLRAMGDLPS